MCCFGNVECVGCVGGYVGEFVYGYVVDVGYYILVDVVEKLVVEEWVVDFEVIEGIWVVEDDDFDVVFEVCFDCVFYVYGECV